MLGNIIAVIIWIIHLILFIGIVASVFVPYSDINSIKFRFKLWIFILLVFLLMQYLTGYQRCGLTEFEYFIKKENYKEGFLYRLIKPVITIPESYFDKYVVYLHIVWVIILGYQLNIHKKIL